MNKAQTHLSFTKTDQFTISVHKLQKYVQYFNIYIQVSLIPLCNNTLS
jgi:hypothetical protein